MEFGLDAVANELPFTVKPNGVALVTQWLSGEQWSPCYDPISTLWTGCFAQPVTGWSACFTAPSTAWTLIS